MMQWVYLCLAVMAASAVTPLNGLEVLTTVSCSSHIGRTNGRWQFSESRCPIPGVSADTFPRVSLHMNRYPYNCKMNNAYEVKIEVERNEVFIVVRKGCNGIFNVTYTRAEVTNTPGCGLAKEPKAFRVINGQASTVPCQFPWMAMVYNSQARTFCGSSILGPRHLLTAAHCVVHPGKTTTYPVTSFYVYTGANEIPIYTLNIKGLYERQVSKLFVHEGYNDTSLANDIAILKLTSRIKFDDCHKPVCLVNSTAEVGKAGNCRVMGWGYASVDPNAVVQESVRWANQEIASSQSCATAYQNQYTANVFCARGVGNDGSDACTGDSGGPLVCRDGDVKNYVQYGVVSAGVKGQKCGQSYGLYTKVNRYLDWILATLKK